MSRPQLEGEERPTNLVVELRETFGALNGLAITRLVEHGHTDIRPAHAAVFQFLDDTGTTVSTLAARAQITKQAMAELVAHLEQLGYVIRVPDPSDRRAKLVLPTDRGLEVFGLAQRMVPEIHRRVAQLLGDQRLASLRQDLRTIYADVTTAEATRPDNDRHP
ncbi:MAG TPA: MarR family transcriptional regulator [Microlunatus sp.]|jgi:DNA-binding MarR family transcriptional regulator|nr:MarR family transcriptional regulator [Microlunatus sp.]